jgi:hypothetical protein
MTGEQAIAWKVVFEAELSGGVEVVIFDDGGVEITSGYDQIVIDPKAAKQLAKYLQPLLPGGVRWNLH